MIKKTIKISLILFILPLLFFSCSPESSNLSKLDIPSRQFWLKDLLAGDFIQITAEQLAEGKYSTIWVEEGINFSVGKAGEIAAAFDNVILPRLMNTYALRGDIIYGGQTFANIMELADWLGDGDGKLRILFFNRVESASYFLFTDLAKINSNHEWAKYSNNSDMIYISHALLSTNYLNGVIAHELAHLINYLNGLVLGRPRGAQDLWINEGLATGAEWLFYDGHPPYRWWRHYNVARVMRLNTAHRSIGLGNVFWNAFTENPFTDWPDYFTPYLFFSWLRLQAGTDEIWHDIITSKYCDFRSITEAASKHMPGQGYEDWETLFRIWLAATYINAPDGPFGYKNDAVLSNIRPKILPPGTTTINLAPGEGVFSIVYPGFTIPFNEGNIRYMSIRNDPPALSDSEIFYDGVLLTYNANSDARGKAETGRSSGLPARNTTLTKFEGSWIGRLPHSPPLNHIYLNFSGNAFYFRQYENGQRRISRSGLFFFTDTEMTFIPMQAGSWEGYTQRYSLSANELTLESGGRGHFGVFIKQ